MKLKSRCKINLFLHVTGKRANGYHELESLFYFPDIYDEIEFHSGTEGYDFTGNFAPKLGLPEDNIIYKAYHLLKDKFPSIPELHFNLVKNLPVSSGIGGGSANAATVLKGLNEAFLLGLAQKDLFELGVKLGADVPPCIYNEPCLVKGVGEIIEKAQVPKLFILLVNPLIPVPTADIFKMGFSEYSQPLDREMIFHRTQSLIYFLETTTNDLEKSALKFCPQISEVKDLISRQEGCLFTRMSGSGATCFGIFKTRDKASIARDNISEEKPGWWVAAG